jgi:GAF domain-containing protein/HAMP domain-containing protein
MALAQVQEQESGERQERRQRDAFVLSLIVAASLLILSLGTWLVFAPSGEGSTAIVPALAGVAVLAGAFLIRRGYVFAGIALSLIALAAAYLFLVTQFSGVGPLAAVVFALIAIAIVTQTFPAKYIPYALALAAMVGAVFVLLELFWPGAQRAPLSDAFRLAIWISLAVGLMALLYILRRFSEYNLRDKLIAGTLIVALVPLFILLILSNSATSDVLVADANQRLLAAARQTAVSVDDFFLNQLSTIRAEATVLETAEYFSLPAEARAETAEAEALLRLKTFRDKDPLNISSYAVLDPQGNKLLEYPPNVKQVDEMGADYLIAPLEIPQPYASAVEFTRDDESAEAIAGGPFLYFSAPLRDLEDQTIGVLRARYKANVLQQLIARGTGLVGGQSFAVLFDENALHLAHGTAPETIFKLVAPISPEEVAELQMAERLPISPEEELSTDLPDLARFLSNAAQEPFFSVKDTATGDRIDQVAVTPMETQAWQVAFFQPQDVFLASIQDQTRLAIILALAVTFIVVVVAILLARLLTGPIVRLESVAARVAQGDLDSRAEVESDDEIGSLATTFNLMTGRLQGTLAGLEQRVVDRTRALATSTEVGRRLSTILDQQRLVKEVVEQVQGSFDYYHVHIYLFDDSGDDLVMVGGTGEPGRIMLERGHRIERGKGIVGRSAASNTIALVPNVADDPDWLANPLLPETKSEVAVPIAIGDQVLGVLDVQDDEVNRLQQEDAALLLSISNQVAIALQNARSYAQIQRLAQRRALINEISRKIQSTGDEESAMQIAVRELGRAAGGRYTRVRLDGPSDGQDGNSSGNKE